MRSLRIVRIPGLGNPLALLSLDCTAFVGDEPAADRWGQREVRREGAEAANELAHAATSFN